MKSTLLAGLSELGLSLSSEQIDQFCQYGQLLLEKNQHMNLTAITEPAAVAQLHFLDSLALLHLAEFSGARVIDVGCGAGFPGLPLKLAEPSIQLTLLDSLGKRMRWLEQELIPQLGTQAQCLTGRAEELCAGRRETYDIAVSRAVARLNILCELCLPYVRPGGTFLAMKGAMASDEALEANNAIKKLGGRMERIAEYPIAGAVHRVVIIQKLRPTPPQYPRRFSKIKQQPL